MVVSITKIRLSFVNPHLYRKKQNITRPYRLYDSYKAHTVYVLLFSLFTYKGHYDYKKRLILSRHSKDF
jgi:hypothetical protein